MKLRNKKTGYITELDLNIRISGFPNSVEFRKIKSLAELNEGWEDAPEEPKERWAIDQFGEPINVTWLSRLQLAKLHRFGNDFPSEDATIKAIEKLEAWQRLKDKGFRFTFWDIRSGSGKDGHCEGEFVMFSECPDDIEKADLDLLFGGEDEQ